MLPMRTINQILIDCSRTPNGRPFTALDLDARHGQQGIRRVQEHWRDIRHVQENWPKWALWNIAHHYVIGIDGRVEPGRTENESGAYCPGHNTGSIGICLIGCDRYTRAQWDALAQTVALPLPLPRVEAEALPL
jgi:N-acetyl-anhydromuramyl-L-alanine amidase AmpD